MRPLQRQSRYRRLLRLFRYSLFEWNISLRMGQAPVIHYVPELYEQIKEGVFDPTDSITHRLPLSEAEHQYDVFDTKKEDCIKVALKP